MTRGRKITAQEEIAAAERQQREMREAAERERMKAEQDRLRAELIQQGLDQHRDRRPADGRGRRK